MKRWTQEEIDILSDELKLGSSHEYIGTILGRTKSSVMHKVQSLGLSRKFKSYNSLTKEDCIDLVRKFKTATAFDYNDELPGHKVILRVLGVSKWSEALKMCDLPPNISGRYSTEKSALFYVLKFIDDDGTEFYKYGYTQRQLKERYKSNKYESILENEVTLQQALELEKLYAKNKTKYYPKSRNFYYEVHGGYTECFVEDKFTEL